MKKLVTIALTIALIGVAANAVPIANDDARVVFDKADLGPIGPGGANLFQFKFFLKDKDPQGSTTAWTPFLVFTPESNSSGFYNEQATVGGTPFGDINTLGEAVGVNPMLTYDIELDSWWNDDFNAVVDDPDVGGGHQVFTPADVSVLVFGQGGDRTLLIQLVSDGDIRWEGQTGRSGVAGGAAIPLDGTTIPEPATMGLMLFGAIGMIARKRRS